MDVVTNVITTASNILSLWYSVDYCESYDKSETELMNSLNDTLSQFIHKFDSVFFSLEKEGVSLTKEVQINRNLLRVIGADLFHNPNNEERSKEFKVFQLKRIVEMCIYVTSFSISKIHEFFFFKLSKIFLRVVIDSSCSSTLILDSLKNFENSFRESDLEFIHTTHSTFHSFFEELYSYVVKISQRNSFTSITTKELFELFAKVSSFKISCFDFTEFDKICVSKISNPQNILFPKIFNLIYVLKSSIIRIGHLTKPPSRIFEFLLLLLNQLKTDLHDIIQLHKLPKLTNDSSSLFQQVHTFFSICAEKKYILPIFCDFKIIESITQLQKTPNDNDLIELLLYQIESISTTSKYHKCFKHHHRHFLIIAKIALLKNDRRKAQQLIFQFDWSCITTILSLYYPNQLFESTFSNIHHCILGSSHQCNNLNTTNNEYMNVDLAMLKLLGKDKPCKVYLYMMASINYCEYMFTVLGSLQQGNFFRDTIFIFTQMIFEFQNYCLKYVCTNPKIKEKVKKLFDSIDFSVENIIKNQKRFMSRLISITKYSFFISVDLGWFFKVIAKKSSSQHMFDLLHICQFFESTTFQERLFDSEIIMSQLPDLLKGLSFLSVHSKCGTMVENIVLTHGQIKEILTKEELGDNEFCGIANKWIYIENQMNFLKNYYSPTLTTNNLSMFAFSRLAQLLHLIQNIRESYYANMVSFISVINYIYHIYEEIYYFYCDKIKVVDEKGYVFFTKCFKEFRKISTHHLLLLSKNCKEIDDIFLNKFETSVTALIESILSSGVKEGMFYHMCKFICFKQNKNILFENFLKHIQLASSFCCFETYSEHDSKKRYHFKHTHHPTSFFFIKTFEKLVKMDPQTLSYDNIKNYYVILIHDWIYYQPFWYQNLCIINWIQTIQSLRSNEISTLTKQKIFKFGIANLYSYCILYPHDNIPQFFLKTAKKIYDNGIQCNDILFLEKTTKLVFTEDKLLSKGVKLFNIIIQQYFKFHHKTESGIFSCHFFKNPTNFKFVMANVLCYFHAIEGFVDEQKISQIIREYTKIQNTFSIFSKIPHNNNTHNYLTMLVQSFHRQFHLFLIKNNSLLSKYEQILHEFYQIFKVIEVSYETMSIQQYLTIILTFQQAKLLISKIIDSVFEIEKLQSLPVNFLENKPPTIFISEFKDKCHYVINELNKYFETVDVNEFKNQYSQQHYTSRNQCSSFFQSTTILFTSKYDNIEMVFLETTNAIIDSLNEIRNIEECVTDEQKIKRLGYIQKIKYSLFTLFQCAQIITRKTFPTKELISAFSPFFKFVLDKRDVLLQYFDSILQQYTDNCFNFDVDNASLMLLEFVLIPDFGLDLHKLQKAKIVCTNYNNLELYNECVTLSELIGCSYRDNCLPSIINFICTSTKHLNQIIGIEPNANTMTDNENLYDIIKKRCKLILLSHCPSFSHVTSICFKFFKSSQTLFSLRQRKFVVPETLERTYKMKCISLFETSCDIELLKKFENNILKFVGVITIKMGFYPVVFEIIDDVLKTRDFNVDDVENKYFLLNALCVVSPPNIIPFHNQLMSFFKQPTLRESDSHIQNAKYLSQTLKATTLSFSNKLLAYSKEIVEIVEKDYLWNASSYIKQATSTIHRNQINIINTLKDNALSFYRHVVLSQCIVRVDLFFELLEKKNEPYEISDLLSKDLTKEITTSCLLLITELSKKLKLFCSDPSLLLSSVLSSGFSFSIQKCCEFMEVILNLSKNLISNEIYNKLCQYHKQVQNTLFLNFNNSCPCLNSIHNFVKISRELIHHETYSQPQNISDLKREVEFTNFMSFFESAIQKLQTKQHINYDSKSVQRIMNLFKKLPNTINANNFSEFLNCVLDYCAVEKSINEFIYEAINFSNETTFCQVWSDDNEKYGKFEKMKEYLTETVVCLKFLHLLTVRPCTIQSFLKSCLIDSMFNEIKGIQFVSLIKFSEYKSRMLSIQIGISKSLYYFYYTLRKNVFIKNNRVLSECSSCIYLFKQYYEYIEGCEFQESINEGNAAEVIKKYIIENYHIQPCWIDYIYYDNLISSILNKKDIKYDELSETLLEIFLSTTWFVMEMLDEQFVLCIDTIDNIQNIIIELHIDYVFRGLSYEILLNRTIQQLKKIKSISNIFAPIKALTYIAAQNFFDNNYFDFSFFKQLEVYSTDLPQPLGSVLNKTLNLLYTSERRGDHLNSKIFMQRVLKAITRCFDEIALVSERIHQQIVYFSIANKDTTTSWKLRDALECELGRLTLLQKVYGLITDNKFGTSTLQKTVKLLSVVSSLSKNGEMVTEELRDEILESLSLFIAPHSLLIRKLFNKLRRLSKQSTKSVVIDAIEELVLLNPGKVSDSFSVFDVLNGQVIKHVKTHIQDEFAIFMKLLDTNVGDEILNVSELSNSLKRIRMFRSDTENNFNFPLDTIKSTCKYYIDIITNQPSYFLVQECLRDILILLNSFISSQMSYLSNMLIIVKLTQVLKHVLVNTKQETVENVEEMIKIFYEVIDVINSISAKLAYPQRILLLIFEFYRELNTDIQKNTSGGSTLNRIFPKLIVCVNNIFLNLVQAGSLYQIGLNFYVPSIDPVVANHILLLVAEKQQTLLNSNQSVSDFVEESHSKHNHFFGEIFDNAFPVDKLSTMILAKEELRNNAVPKHLFKREYDAVELCYPLLSLNVYLKSNDKKMLDCVNRYLNGHENADQVLKFIFSFDKNWCVLRSFSVALSKISLNESTCYFDLLSPILCVVVVIWRECGKPKNLLQKIRNVLFSTERKQLGDSGKLAPEEIQSILEAFHPYEFMFEIEDIIYLIVEIFGELYACFVQANSHIGVKDVSLKYFSMMGGCPVALYLLKLYSTQNEENYSKISSLVKIFEDQYLEARKHVIDFTNVDEIVCNIENVMFNIVQRICDVKRLFNEHINQLLEITEDGKWQKMGLSERSTLMRKYCVFLLCTKLVFDDNAFFSLFTNRMLKTCQDLVGMLVIFPTPQLPNHIYKENTSSLCINCLRDVVTITKNAYEFTVKHTLNFPVIIPHINVPKYMNYFPFEGYGELRNRTIDLFMSFEETKTIENINNKIELFLLSCDAIALSKKPIGSMDNTTFIHRIHRYIVNYNLLFRDVLGMVNLIYNFYFSTEKESFKQHLEELMDVIFKGFDQLSDL
ncbi:hypothetical protein QTN25_010014 [Entamoeba marina]